MIDLEHYYMRLRYHLDSLLDLRYGGYFGGFQKSRYAHLGAQGTSSSFYFVLSRLFRKYPVKESDVLVDVGCGKGRVINWWLRKGYRNRIIGIELDEILAARARKTFGKYENVEIVCGNAIDAIPADGTVFYIYNSFTGTVMQEFRDRLKQTCRRMDDVRIYYVCTEFLDAFKGDPDWVVRTNYEAAKNDPEWPVQDLDFGISYTVAIIEPVKGRKRLACLDGESGQG